MFDFLIKFFGYKENTDGVMDYYRDGLGAGAFNDIRHLLWALSVVLLCFLAYGFFKRHPKGGRKTVIVLSVMMFTVRLANQTIRALIGAENPFWRAFPFHMCTVMTFLLPIVMVFNIKPLKMPVGVISIMGGIVTIIMGDYFDDRFMTFSNLEGMAAHTLLILIPVIAIAIGDMRVEFKKSASVIAGMFLLILWATIANKIFFAGEDTNYMYLERNGLPGDLGGDYYFLIYMAIFFLFFAIIFGWAEICHAARATKERKKNGINPHNRTYYG